MRSSVSFGTVGRDLVRRVAGGKQGVHPPGILYECQKKGVVKFAICKWLKRKNEDPEVDRERDFGLRDVPPVFCKCCS
jgi:hypothetical protein